MPKLIDASLIAIIVVGIIGFMILRENSTSKSFTNVISMEMLGYLLFGFAVCVGLMYTVAPIPTVQTRKEPVSYLFEGGGEVDEVSGGGYDAGSVLDAMTGGYLQKDGGTLATGGGEETEALQKVDAGMDEE